MWSRHGSPRHGPFPRRSSGRTSMRHPCWGVAGAEADHRQCVEAALDARGTMSAIVVSEFARCQRDARDAEERPRRRQQGRLHGPGLRGRRQADLEGLCRQADGDVDEARTERHLGQCPSVPPRGPGSCAGCQGTTRRSRRRSQTAALGQQRGPVVDELGRDGLRGIPDADVPASITAAAARAPARRTRLRLPSAPICSRPSFLRSSGQARGPRPTGSARRAHGLATMGSGWGRPIRSYSSSSCALCSRRMASSPYSVLRRSSTSSTVGPVEGRPSRRRR
jgi:hypothetical protein